MRCRGDGAFIGTERLEDPCTACKGACKGTCKGTKKAVVEAYHKEIQAWKEEVAVWEEEKEILQKAFGKLSRREYLILVRYLDGKIEF